MYFSPTFKSRRVFGPLYPQKSTENTRSFSVALVPLETNGSPSLREVAARENKAVWPKPEINCSIVPADTEKGSVDPPHACHDDARKRPTYAARFIFVFESWSSCSANKPREASTSVNIRHQNSPACGHRRLLFFSFLPTGNVITEYYFALRLAFGGIHVPGAQQREA